LGVEIDEFDGIARHDALDHPHPLGFSTEEPGGHVEDRPAGQQRWFEGTQGLNTGGVGGFPLADDRHERACIDDRSLTHPRTLPCARGWWRGRAGRP
jgi:hypothetical protein